MNTLHPSSAGSGYAALPVPSAGYGFMVGTPVHTNTGTKPIDLVEVGDLVLSRLGPEGEPTYKRVMRTARHESNMVCRVSCHKLVDGSHVYQNLIVAADHPFYVLGRQREEWEDDDSWAHIPKFTGWQRADWLSGRDIVLLAGGETIRVSMSDRIWRTKQEGVGWIAANPDGDLGHLIDFRDGHLLEAFETLRVSDFIGVGTFGIRYETPEMEAEWGYTCTVYDLEVEDFCTYLVGELGVWVRGGQSGIGQPTDAA